MQLKPTYKRLILPFSLALSFVFLIAGIVFSASNAGHGTGEIHNSWLTIDTWKTLNFLILVIGIFFVVKKPATNFFSSRIKDIENKINDLEEKKIDAQKQLAEYKKQFEDLEQESKQIVDDYIKQGQASKKIILEHAKIQAQKLEDTAKHNIEQEFKLAKEKLQKEIAGQAVKKAKTMIETQISSEDQDKLVDDYLKKVVV